jgi:hypothetical protein
MRLSKRAPFANSRKRRESAQSWTLPVCYRGRTAIRASVSSLSSGLPWSIMAQRVSWPDRTQPEPAGGRSPSIAPSSPPRAPRPPRSPRELLLAGQSAWNIGSGSFSMKFAGELSEPSREEVAMSLPHCLGSLVPPSLVVEAVDIRGETIVIRASARLRQASCPSCRCEANRIHSRYVRNGPDLP